MQPKHDEAGRRQRERDLPVEESPGEEPDFETEVSEATGKGDSVFDADLNPIDDPTRAEDVNTDGSER